MAGGRALLVLAASTLLAVALLYVLFGRSQTAFDELALGTEPKSAYGRYDGDPIHCATLEDAQRCLDPAAARRLDRAVLWLGNSQLHAINQLKDGEVPAAEILARHLRPQKVEVIAFSQPNASLGEHLVMLEALAGRLPFKTLVLPLVYDDTRETSIRGGVALAIDDIRVRQELTRGEAGRRIVDQIVAIQAREQKQAGETLMDRSEQRITDLLEWCCRWETLRRQARGSIAYGLYVTRNTVFGIKPTSKRRKIASAYDLNLAALGQVMARARSLGISTVAYIAPLRADAERPYVDSEYEAFKQDAARLAQLHGATLLDLEGLVPDRFWGSKDATSIGGAPEIDFMHFQFPGHVLLGDAIAKAIVGGER